MQTRRMILERAGHRVTSAQDLREVIAACRSAGFAVVILGQSLPRNEKLRVRDVVHIECRDAKVLELHTGIAPELPSPDAHLHVATGAPEALVDSVTDLIATRNSRGA